MKFQAKITQPEQINSIKTGCIVIALFEENQLSSSAEAIDNACNGYITKLITRGDANGRAGKSLLLTGLHGVKAERILLIGMGKKGETSAKQFIDGVTAAITALKESPATEADYFFSEVAVANKEASWAVRQQVEVSDAALYTLDQFKRKKSPAVALKSIRISTTDEMAVAQGVATARGVTLAKDLSNLPGSLCTPSYLAEQAEQLAQTFSNIKTSILDEAEMEALGMGSLLSVSRGSRQPAKLIVMQYQGGKKGDQPIALVGKGLTFDSGGISLKPGPQMDEMKYDMCGGASVFGTIQAAAELELPINIVAVIPSSENMPDGDANKPGDIVTSMSGQTIEILNTDAEGRLILCDALTYTAKFNPAIVIDIATLTGACIIALGGQASGLMTNNQPLADALLDAGQKCGDRAWQLPIWDEYQEQLKSPFADMQNIGGREAGTITAACFLSRFTEEYHWAHLDIAGTAWISGAKKGATGRPVPLLMQYLIDQANTK